jgi:hypothetical protein
VALDVILQSPALFPFELPHITPKDFESMNRLEMFREGGDVETLAFRDGIHWQKPTLDVQPGTNIVQPGGRDSSTVWLDLEEKDPKRRFKRAVAPANIHIGKQQMICPCCS